MDRHHATVAAFDQLAQAYQDTFMDLSLYDDSYDQLARLLPPQGRVLELGCGPGNLTRALLRRRPDLHILATDPAPNMLRLAAQNNPGLHCQRLAAHEISQLNELFNAVVAGFCLPYLSPTETAQLTRDAAALLTPDGLCYLSFIEGEAARSGFELASNGQAGAYVYYHPAATIRADLEAAGFEVLTELRKPYQRANGQADTHTILLARKA